MTLSPIRGGYLTNKNCIYPLIKDNILLFKNSSCATQDCVSVINRQQSLPIPIQSIQKTYTAHSIHLQQLKDTIKADSFNNLSKHDKLKIHNKYHNISMLNNAYKTFIEYTEPLKITHVYFTYKLCFRGRLYIPGIISPTADKELRKHILSSNLTETVEVDARASMLQILAVISCSVKLARITNLIGASNGQPLDT